MKSKGTAAILCFFFGGIGIHKFYLGQGGMGVAYLIFCWTFIPAVIAFFEFFILLFMNEDEFNRKFNGGLANGGGSMQQNVVIHVPTANAHAGLSFADQLHKLNDLRVQGALTDEEFATQKQRLLTTERTAA